MSDGGSGKPAREEEAPSVIKGVLTRVSPNSMSTADPDDTWGCLRKFWYRYVKGIQEPETIEMTQGVFLHDMDEEYLKTGKLLLGTQKYTDWFNAGRPFLDQIKPRVVGVEQQLPKGFKIAGLPLSVNSRCDVVLDGPPGIHDHKTTKNIKKKLERIGKLSRNIQLVTYAEAFFPDDPMVELSHGYYQTEGPVKFYPHIEKVSRGLLDSYFGGVIVPLVEKMKLAAAETDVKKVSASRSFIKCKRCPHQSYCPPDKENPLMAVFDKFKKKSPDAAGAAPASTPAPVAPPDAPASKPALAAKPVDGFQAVPPPKKGAAPVVEDEEAKLERQLAEAKAKKKAAAEAAAAAAAEAEAAAAAGQGEGSEDNEEETPEAKKARGGRPPGAKNKPKFVEAPGGSVRAVYGVTMNLGTTTTSASTPSSPCAASPRRWRLPTSTVSISRRRRSRPR
jgi:hypothetical protein